MQIFSFQDINKNRCDLISKTCNLLKLPIFSFWSEKEHSEIKKGEFSIKNHCDVWACPALFSATLMTIWKSTLKLKATPYRGAITVLKVTPAIPDGAMKWLWEVKDRFFSSRKKCFHTYSSVCSAVCSVCAAVWGIRFNQVMKFLQVTFSQKRTIFNPYRTNFYL